MSLVSEKKLATALSPPPPPMPSILSMPLSPPKKIKPSFGAYCPDPYVELESHIQYEKDRQLKPEDPTVLKIFHPITPILQDGPNCGMVALASGLSKSCFTPDGLKQLAIDNGWSRCGEMFSCTWMTQLALLCDVGRAVRIKGGLDSHLNCIADCISNGGFLLAPYDKMKNHAPGLQGGVSAHWAIITGLVVIKSSGGHIDPELTLKPCQCVTRSSASIANECCLVIDGCNSEYGITVIEEECIVKKVVDKTAVAAIYVCAYQGLSQHVNLWPFSTLCASNNNLKKSDKRLDEFIILPPGGVEVGLCGKGVLVYPPL